MPQQTNLNVAPYFDDFDANNDYHKVLFKPGYPVQARELTTLQSILQNQIEKFGQHFFKEGARVIPGNIGYTQLYYCVQLNNVYQGVPVSAYADQLVGTKITGQVSGVTAFVDKVLLPEDSERGNLTLYINYLNSNTQNNATQVFSDGEGITCNQTISSTLLGNSTIAAGAPLAITLGSGAAATGSSFQIQDGVYFIRGNFVNVSRETLILDQYTNKPNYRVGLFVNEEVINADLDETLNDNSQGFNNYSAPGADRLKISVSLFKKALDDFNDDNFVELATIVDGAIRSQVKRGGENNPYGGNFELLDTIARRTYLESGDYYVKPFDITAFESLNNNQGNRGIFQEGQLTPGGVTPSDDSMIYKVSPGKAFVRGYELETNSPIFLDADKPRTTKEVKNQKLIYNTGPTLKLNRVFGNPSVGIGNTYVLSLRSEKVGSNQRGAYGDEIGLARVYDFALESGSYDSNVPNLNEWDIALYDVQPVTDITLNEPVTLATSTYVKGANSGATGFLKDAVTAGIAVTIYDREGDFQKDERLIFSRTNSNGSTIARVATAVTAHSLSDVKSVFGSLDGTVGLQTFSADVIQSTAVNVGIATITAFSGGFSTVRSTNPLFPTGVKEGGLIEYSDQTRSTDPITARVVSVGSSHLLIAGVTTVTNLYSGNLPEYGTNGVTANDFKILTTQLTSSSDNTLFTQLPKNHVSNVDLTDATITIRKTFTVNISGNKLSSAVTAGENQTFATFDEERYSLVRTDGTNEVLTADRFDFLSGAKSLQIRNLGSDDTGAQLVATVIKAKPKAKVKLKNRVNSVTIVNSIDRSSGVGTTTLNDGLTFGGYPFGTRVQDEVISLNTPDVVQIHGIFESADTSNPSAPKVTLSNINSASTTTEELIVGELITGQTSNAVAIVAEKLTSSQIAFLFKNQNRFVEGETVVFAESNVRAQVTTLSTPSFDISGEYTFRSGQELTYYDQGLIKRKPEFDPASRRLKVYFSNGFYESTDDGDLTTVNSYDEFNYARDLSGPGGLSVSDIIDIRPRVSDYTISEDSRSPLEFKGRTFDGSGNSAGNILASDEDLTTTFSYYQGRIDRIFLTKDGAFQIKYGTPSDKPEKPGAVDDALEIATAVLPPYLYHISQISLNFLEHKRFQMKDIKGLENRIQNLEYYTSLSLLETNTANLFIPDSEGLNRFKSGFFVDNFTSFQPQESGLQIKNSIDRSGKELRPRHYTNSVDLIFGPVVNTDATEDVDFAPIEGINVRKENDIITLDYNETEYIKQSFATRTESVTPFLISFWQGTMELTPASDTWIDTVRLDPKIIDVEGDYASTLNRLSQTEGVDPQTGLGPIIWNAWETTWVGTSTQDLGTRTRTENRRINTFGIGGWINGGSGVAQLWETTEETVITEEVTRTIETTNQARTGSQIQVTEQFDRTSVGDRTVSRDLIPYMRSRNIQFVAKRVKPLTRLYAFFDGIDVTKYCVPKLLEISMTSGTFQVGETVTGRIIQTGLGEANTDVTPAITFRVAQSNHREGPYNAATKVYPDNPYTNTPLASTYSSTSNILNVDTFSLQRQGEGAFSGWVGSNMVLTGSTSGAQATITNVRLVSDLSATLIGSYFIPNPNNLNHPRFETGGRVLTLINDEDNDQDIATTITEETFTAEGTLETVQENIVSVRNARVENRQEFQERSLNRDLGTQTNVINRRSGGQQQRQIGWYDPLAQSFLVEDPTGVFVTSCDVFFRSKDDMDIPLVFQLRTMKNGFPTQRVIPFSEIVLDPGEINVSPDGSVATTVQFKAPVYLEGGNTEYAICLASNSTKYSVYISRIGENDLLSDTFISNQPYLGSLFKSQNASTWEPSQWEDLKFTLYRAEFVNSGNVEFYNPQLTQGNNQIPKLMPNSINLKSRSIRVGLGTTVHDSGLQLGNNVLQQGTNASGNLVGTAGTLASITIQNAGIGYTPSASTLTYDNVNLVTITGSGRGATADITISNGSIVASGATISNGGGTGYQVGDIVGISTIGSNDFKNLGTNARLSITSIGSTSELILDNVQGEFVVGTANTIMYVSSAGITTELGYTNGGDVQIGEIDIINDGLHFTVDHKNHGMYYGDNRVQISGVKPDVKPTKLTAPYTDSSVSSLSVENASQFATFENVGVGTTNAGYLLIGDEVIEYTSVDGNTVGGNIVRGTGATNYPTGTPVFKYELGGVNLHRINKTHTLSDATTTDPITFDSYDVKVDMSTKFNTDNDDRSNDVGYPKLYINQTKSTGGDKTRATQNMPFELITPLVQNLSVQETSLTAEIRTVTSKSLDGSEIPYIDAGFEPIVLNEANYFDSARAIFSKVNEDAKLSNLPGSKSMNMRLTLTTLDTKVSPVIDAQRVSAILTSNRINNPVSNFATDSRVNSALNDPNACQYISKEVVLENSATGLKVLLAGHVNTNSDIRVFYAINNEPGSEPIFVPFPGYSNLDDRGRVISIENNNGESDVFVTKTNTYGFTGQELQFRDYTFTMDDLPAFKSYRIKIVLTSTDQVYVPRVKDLRVMALA